MENNWNKFKLSEALEIKYGKDHKKVESGNIPIYGTGGVMRYGNQFLYDKETILIPRKGSLNNIYYLNQPFWCVDTIFWSKVNELLAFPKYLYYSLKILDFASMDVGSAVPSLTTEVLKRIDIRLPTLKEQIAIASILSALDDKIELNLQINKTLEEMAMALYKHWFVDFGPFQNGKFIDSELGMIPEGWEVKRLDDLIQALSKGTTPRMKDVIGLENKIPFLKVKDIKNDGDINTLNIDLIPEETHLKELKRSVLKYGDILFSIAGTIGRVSSVSMHLDNSNCNQALAFIRLTNKEDYKSLIYYWLKSEAVQNKISNSVVQGVQANVSLTVLKELLISLPDSLLLRDFANSINPIFNQVLENQEENRLLIKTRDTLLPKLISGEVRVKDILHLAEASL